MADRFAVNGEMITIPKNTPGPKYIVSDRLKYNKPPSWKIGSGRRPPIYTNEKFEYYNHQYDTAFDFGNQPRKWKRITGGAMALDPKINYKVKEDIPGPGRYDPDVRVVKTKPPSYYLGEKAKYNSLNLLVGTNEIVGPGTYKVREAPKTSKHTEPPTWTIGKCPRKGLNNTVWTKNETYHLYS
jgi:hypothetical protein